MDYKLCCPRPTSETPALREENKRNPDYVFRNVQINCKFMLMGVGVVISYPLFRTPGVEHNLNIHVSPRVRLLRILLKFRFFLLFQSSPGIELQVKMNTMEAEIHSMKKHILRRHGEEVL